MIVGLLRVLAASALDATGLDTVLDAIELDVTKLPVTKLAGPVLAGAVLGDAVPGTSVFDDAALVGFAVASGAPPLSDFAIPLAHAYQSTGHLTQSGCGTTG